jgi:hypothetical protein
MGIRARRAGLVEKVKRDLNKEETEGTEKIIDTG